MKPPTANSAQALGEQLQERSAEFEALGQLPEDVTQSLLELGVFHMLIPDRYGGFEQPVSQAFGVLEALGYADGAVGWCAMIAATTSMQAAWLDEPFARELFESEQPLACGVAEPRGRAKPVDGGVEVTGQWAWGSASFQSKWIGGGCLVVADENEGIDRSRGPFFAFFKRDQVTLHDNWQVAGLEATGSCDFSVEQAFVPDGRYAVLGARRGSTLRFTAFRCSARWPLVLLQSRLVWPAARCGNCERSQSPSGM